MNLSDSVIVKEIQNGNIILEPFNVDYLNPNSVDLTLNPTYKVMDRLNQFNEEDDL
jgi:deoxycytidine triphosphate deaminase